MNDKQLAQKSVDLTMKKFGKTIKALEEYDSGKEWDWALKELGWDEPKYGWTHEKKILRALIKKSKQGGL